MRGDPKFYANALTLQDEVLPFVKDVSPNVFRQAAPPQVGHGKRPAGGRIGDLLKEGDRVVVDSHARGYRRCFPSSRGIAPLGSGGAVAAKGQWTWDAAITAAAGSECRRSPRTGGDAGRTWGQRRCCRSRGTARSASQGFAPIRRPRGAPAPRGWDDQRSC